MYRNILGLLMCLWSVFVLAETLSGDELEKSFEAGSYQEFFRVAQQMAQQGNVDALFLLGKAYHLGKGVDPDPERARDFYEMAAKQNSAKAENNLGQMEMEKDPDDGFRLALEHFNRALELGLKLPTLYNLGKGYMNRCSNLLTHQEGKPCILAGDNYLNAWRIERRDSALDDAVKAYLSACVINWQFAGGTKANDQQKPVAGCKEAREWAEKGAELGLVRATFNRGAIEFNTERYAEALPWFHRANERGFGLAAYALGDMYEKGLGLPKDEAVALQWFKRGAELKDEQATLRMSSYWIKEMTNSYDVSRIEAAVEEWGKLSSSQGYPSEAEYSLELIETLATNKEKSPDLARESIPDRLCLNEEMLYENTYWALFALTKPEEATEPVDMLPLLAKGLIDAGGCARLSSKARSTLRKALSEGATLMFSWPGQRYLLWITHSPNLPLEMGLGLKVR